MGKGSSGTKTTYTSSPEQAQIYSALLPMIQNLSSLGASQVGQTNMGAPLAPTMPSMSGVLSGAPMYNIPSTSSIMPTQSWYNSLSPEVKAGVWAPYEEGANMLSERMGGSGQLGSARGGYSGAAGAAMGDYYSNAVNQAGTQLWNMSAPGAMAGWNALLTQNQMGYNNLLQERTKDYSNEMARLGSDYDVARQAWGIPFGLTGMAPSTFSQGITTQPGSTNWLGALSGGALGGMMGYSAMGNSGYGGILGGIGGAAGGMK